MASMSEKVTWRLLLVTAGATIVICRVFLLPRVLQAAHNRRVRRARRLMKDAAFYESRGVRFEEEYIVNSRGMKLYAPRWLPSCRTPKALVFMLHGYGVECGLFMSEQALRLASEGFAVYGLDFEGHGQSEGLRAYLPCREGMGEDARAYARGVGEKKEYLGMARFLYGVSMGDAVALFIHRKEPLAWTGAVLLAPMCKISDNMKPPAVIVTLLTWLAYLWPRLTAVPTKDIIEISSRDSEYKAKVRSNPFVYTGMPRLGTALTLLRMCDDLQAHLEEVTIPFLLLHGAADSVTDPSVSEGLYVTARSSDKTFKLYAHMTHCLTEGDTPDACGRVWKDILAWLDDRSNMV